MPASANAAVIRHDDGTWTRLQIVTASHDMNSVDSPAMWVLVPPDDYSPRPADKLVHNLFKVNDWPIMLAAPIGQALRLPQE